MRDGGLHEARDVWQIMAKSGGSVIREPSWTCACDAHANPSHASIDELTADKTFRLSQTRRQMRAEVSRGQPCS
jgi:hypothetical protein